MNIKTPFMSDHRTKPQNSKFSGGAPQIAARVPTHY